MDERNDNIQDEELERYGVWVKAGPEEVFEAEDEFGLADLPQDEAADDDLPSLDDELSSLDDEDGAVDSLDLDEPVSDETSLESGALADDSLDDLDDLDLSDFDDDDMPAMPTMPTSAQLDDDVDASTDGEADEAEAAEEDQAPAPAGTGEGEGEIVIEDLEFEELDEEEFPSALSSSSDEDLAATYGLSGDEDDDLITIDDLDIDEPTEDTDPFSGLPDDELAGEIDLDEVEAPAAIGDDEPIEHEFTPDAAGIDIEPDLLPNHITPDEAQFLDEESDLTPELQETGEHAIPRQMDIQEREAFDRIQTELTDIKRELAELRAALRAGASPAFASDASPAAIDEDSNSEDSAGSALLDDSFTVSDDWTSGGDGDEDAGGTGFFDDDDDETIALTGDELDNILNTAEFTEAEGEAAEIEDDFVIGSDASLEDDDSDDRSLSDGVVDEIVLEPVQHDPVVFEGDESAVDELAEMDIDSELAGIESLTDETEEEPRDEIGDLDIDLDAMDETVGDEDPALDNELATDDELEIDDELAIGDELAVDNELATDDELEIDDELAIGDELAIDDELAVGNEDLDASTIADDAADDDDDADDDGAEGFEEFAATVTDDLTAESDDELEIDLDVDFDAAADDADDSPAAVAAADDDDDEIEIELPGDDDYEDDDEEEADVVAPAAAGGIAGLPEDLKAEIRSVLSYMDQLLEALPDDKIEEFAQSEHFEVYRRLFEELGLET